MRVLFEGTERQLNFKKDPSKHYVLVYKGGSNERSVIEDFLDAGYEIVSDDKTVTGSSALVLMAIDKDIWEASELRRVQHNESLLKEGQSAVVPEHDEEMKEFGGGGHPRIKVGDEVETPDEDLPIIIEE